MIDLDHYFDTPKEICLETARKAALRRKALHISQKELAGMTGVSFASIRRFETTGQISFESLVRIAISIDMKEDVKNLFNERKVYRTIQDVIDEANQKH
jgi:transcriptional regulator with XRE-family HTH domain